VKAAIEHQRRAPNEAAGRYEKYDQVGAYSMSAHSASLRLSGLPTGTIVVVPYRNPCVE